MEQQAAHAVAAASHALVRLLVLTGLVVMLWLLLGVASAHADGPGHGRGPTSAAGLPGRSLETVRDIAPRRDDPSLPDVRRSTHRAVDQVETLAHRTTGGATDPVFDDTSAIVGGLEHKVDEVVHEVRESADPVDVPTPVPGASTGSAANERERESSIKQGDSRRSVTGERLVRTPHVIATPAPSVDAAAGQPAPTGSHALASDPRTPSSPFQAPDLPLVAGLVSGGAAQSGSAGGPACAAVLVDPHARSAPGASTSPSDTARRAVPGPAHAPGCTPD